MDNYEPKYEKPAPKPYHGSTAVSQAPEPQKEKPEKKEKKENKGTRRKIITALLIAVMLIAACGLGYAGAAIYTATHHTTNDTSAARDDGYTLEEATGSSKTISQVASDNADAVVEISTEAISTDSWFGEYVTEGAGSGVVISDDGYIMTNNHVVSGARSITVTLHNGESYKAEVIGVDSVNDVAVLKIKETGLKSVTYGNSDKLNVGEMAVAIGNPLGSLGGTVTAGIISAKDREITVDGKEMRLLQTDASINPGNSGGGLFNQHGQLIGLVVAKSSGSDVEGLGFAIPVNTAAESAQQIIKEGGNVSTGSGEAVIGVTIMQVTSDEDADSYGLNGKGVYITAISGINAQKAGFQLYDKLLKADGKNIGTNQDLLDVLDKHKPGDKIKVDVLRGDKKISITTELMDKSDIPQMEDQNNQNNQNDQDNENMFPFFFDDERP